MLALSTRSYSVTIDAVQQRVFLFAKWLLFGIGEPWAVSFEEIEQVYLNFWELGYTVESADEYTTHSEPWIRRRWAIELILRDGQIMTIGEERTDHRPGETRVLARQQVHWELLAARVSELIGKPLAAMPTAPDSPRTFVQAIDQIVQRRLKQAGLNNSSVNIRSRKDLGIEILVNGKSYASTDEIEDQAVRGLIQASIQEWQGSST